METLFILVEWTTDLRGVDYLIHTSSGAKLSGKSPLPGREEQRSGEVTIFPVWESCFGASFGIYAQSRRTGA